MKAKVEFEQIDGSWLADGKAAGYISENEFELEKVTAGFDGEDGDAKRPNLYRDKIRKKIKNHTYFMTDESDIQYKDGNGDVDVEISESNTVWTYKVFRKTFTVTLNTTDADGTDHTVSSVAETVANTNNKELKYRYGQKPANNPIVTDSQAYKFKEWQLNGEKFEFNGTKEITQDITLTAIFDINLRKATLQLGNLVADNITYPVEDGVTADYSKIQSDGIIELTIRGDKLPYELKPLSFTGTIYDKVTHQPLALDNDGMYSDTKVYNNTTINVKSKPNLDKFKGFYPQDEASSKDSNNVKQHGVKESFYAVLKGNKRFDWTHTYYKGEKYEELGEKIFKYSLVELEESKIKPNFNTSRKLLDNIIGNLSNEGGIGYDNSLAKEYLDKVMSVKIMKYIYLPFIFGKQAMKQNVDAADNDDYQETAAYYKNVTETSYTTYVRDNFYLVRHFDDQIFVGVRSIIGTATNYVTYNGQNLNGFWGFTPETGLIYSAYLWNSNHSGMRRLLIQPIIT